MFNTIPETYKEKTNQEQDFINELKNLNPPCLSTLLSSEDLNYIYSFHFPVNIEKEFIDAHQGNVKAMFEIA